MRTKHRSAIGVLWLALASACGPGTIDGTDAGSMRDATLTPIDAAPADAAPSDALVRGDTGTEPPLVRSSDFAEAAGDVLNPDRGVYWWDWNDEASLVLVKVQLGEHCGAATLPGSVATALRSRMGEHRAAGRRAILRFVYADDGDLNVCGLADAESIEIATGHVAQLAAAMEEHVDVIAYVEAGIFGMWGEWNSEHAPAGTSLWTSQENRRRVLRALLDAVPEERAVLVRRPRFRDELTTFSAADLARLGFHNDCFLASIDDYGTYDGDRSVAEWKEYVRGATTTVPLGGETCRDELPYTACDNATGELEMLRWSYLHEGYRPEVIARWESEGCMDEIRQRLGYRIVLRAVEAPLEVMPGGVLRVRMELENGGYAPPYTTRRPRIVLRSGDASHVLEPFESTGADTRAWAPGATIEVELAAMLPAELAAGTWEVRVALLEDRSDAPAYAMIFANDDRVLDGVRRENVVATVVVPE